MSNASPETPEASASSSSVTQPVAAPAEPSDSPVAAVRRVTVSVLDALEARFPEIKKPETRSSIEPRVVELLRLATALRLDQEASALEPSSRKSLRALRLSQRAYRDAALALEADLLADRILLADAADQRRRAACSAILGAVVRAASVLAESLVRTAATALLKG